jgi:hypothetical protein
VSGSPSPRPSQPHRPGDQHDQARHSRRPRSAVTDASAEEGSPLTGGTLGHITPGSGDAAAGLQSGDIVTALDRPIDSSDLSTLRWVVPLAEQ